MLLQWLLYLLRKIWSIFGDQRERTTSLIPHYRNYFYDLAYGFSLLTGCVTGERLTTTLYATGRLIIRSWLHAVAHQTSQKHQAQTFRLQKSSLLVQKSSVLKPHFKVKCRPLTDSEEAPESNKVPQVLNPAGTFLMIPLQIEGV